MDDESVMRDLTPDPGLALRGVVPDGHLITSDRTTWRWMVSSLMCALTCLVPLVVEMPLRSWLYRRMQASRVVGLDGLEAGDGR